MKEEKCKDLMDNISISQDLKKYAEEYDESFYLEDAVIAGAKRQMQEIMENAIETIVIDDWTYDKHPDNTATPAIHHRIQGYNVGDKVKIIIVKER